MDERIWCGRTRLACTDSWPQPLTFGINYTGDWSCYSCKEWDNIMRCHSSFGNITYGEECFSSRTFSVLMLPSKKWTFPSCLCDFFSLKPGCSFSGCGWHCPVFMFHAKKQFQPNFRIILMLLSWQMWAQPSGLYVWHCISRFMFS